MNRLAPLAILAHAMALATFAAPFCAPSTPVTGINSTVTLAAWSDATGDNARFTWSAKVGTVEQGENGTAKWRITNADDGPLTATVQIQIPGTDPVSCIVTVRVVQNFGGGSRDVNRSAFHSFITPKERTEPAGYGQYSYLIFGAPPKEADKAKYKNILAELLRHVPATAELANYLEPAQVNGIFIPLRKAPEDANTFTDAQVSQMLDQYDYTRATALLRKVPGSRPSGIYLISAAGPLLSPNTKGPYLVQDLSMIPGNLAPTWVGTFVNLAARVQYWKPDSMRDLINNMRYSVAVLAKEVPQVQEAVKKWISTVG